ncbi:hypothetical protein LTR08_000877 [Meristemomyces frigidus]|nr:hypothetical protein LTR08_000877 [Meristemomyces frigidus]
MPDGDQSEPGVSNKSHTPADSHATNISAAAPSRRTSSSAVSTRSQRRSPSPPRESKTPLTPEESPPFRTTRKRDASAAAVEDKELDGASTTPAHSRASSGDSTAHVCICQPDPKIPRPRNAFILYRQHHQAQVVAQHPGLANPEISKIIGELWQNQAPELKTKWKELAEAEKLRHQQQYPTYRYQPKRNGRRSSLSSEAPGSAVEKPKCVKCGGRSILAPSAPFATNSSAASPVSLPPLIPGSAITPISRTLPTLRDLSLQSPAGRRGGRAYPVTNMSPLHNSHMDDRDDVGPFSPDNKRRRFNGEQAQSASRVMPPRYTAVPPGPGTPFPFAQAPPPHPYPPAIAHGRRESLPGLRGIVSPAGPMGPPPRPGMGYSQHRVSQGYILHDRSLTLPPLQTGSGSISGPSGAAAMADSGKSVAEHVMSLSYRYKVKVLGQIAPPARDSQEFPRGPLIAVEGDDAGAVAELAKWLHEELRKGGDLTVTLVDSPDVSVNAYKKAIIQYHQLATEWLSKSDDIIASIVMNVAAEKADHAMSDASPIKEPAQFARKIDDNYDDSDSSTKGDAEKRSGSEKTDAQPAEVEKMEVDKTPTTAKPPTSAPIVSKSKPVVIIPNYSLHASNVFACRIPIGPLEQYSPSDHWQWTATQWRGVVGPDLTIFLRDAIVGDTGKATVELTEEGNLFVVKRTRAAEGDQGLELEASALRRLGFELSEWVRAFGSEKRGGA